MIVRHADCVHIPAVTARFSSDGKHRYSLTIPFANRDTGKQLTVIGQNPSAANEQYADKTVRYLERFVFASLPVYDRIQIVNLYTRIDKRKEYTDVLDSGSDQALKDSIGSGSDVLLVCGRPCNYKAYRFNDRIREILPLLQQANVYKIAIGTDYPPHPGNREILYSRIHLAIDRWEPRRDGPLAGLAAHLNKAH